MVIDDDPADALPEPVERRAAPRGPFEGMRAHVAVASGPVCEYEVAEASELGFSLQGATLGLPVGALVPIEVHRDGRTAALVCAVVRVDPGPPPHVALRLTGQSPAAEEVYRQMLGLETPTTR